MNNEILEAFFLTGEFSLKVLIFWACKEKMKNETLEAFFLTGEFSLKVLIFIWYASFVVLFCRRCNFDWTEK